MNKDIEKELEELGETYSTINIPKDIDSFIQKGIDRGRMRKRRNIRKKILGLAAAVFVAILVTSIRISPAFAAYLSEIPGLGHLVNIVNFDKGLELAIENNFIQHINIYDEHEGISFSVDDIIIDESRMIIFYTIDKGERKYININRIDFLDEKGNLLQAAFSYPGFIDEDMEKQQIVKNQVDIGFVEETIIPDVLKMKVKLMESPLSWSEFSQRHNQLQENSIRDRDRYTEIAGTWEIDIPIDKEQFN
ncbi:MAG: DUF4179 domain-containing protein, partial [Thermotaleaceae bacterium]